MNPTPKIASQNRFLIINESKYSNINLSHKTMNITASSFSDVIISYYVLYYGFAFIGFTIVIILIVHYFRSRKFKLKCVRFNNNCVSFSPTITIDTTPSGNSMNKNTMNRLPLPPPSKQSHISK